VRTGRIATISWIRNQHLALSAWISNWQGEFSFINLDNWRFCHCTVRSQSGNIHEFIYSFSTTPLPECLVFMSTHEQAVQH
jgi:hypothetical protein